MTVQKVKPRHRSSSIHPESAVTYALLMPGRTFCCICIPQLNTGQWVMQYTTLMACSLTLSGQPGQRQITCPIIPPRKRLSPDRLCALSMQAVELPCAILYSGLLRSIPYHVLWSGCYLLFLSQIKQQPHYSSSFKTLRVRRHKQTSHSRLQSTRQEITHYVTVECVRVSAFWALLRWSYDCIHWLIR